jgi:hypothetical protein
LDEVPVSDQVCKSDEEAIFPELNVIHFSVFLSSTKKH